MNLWFQPFFNIYLSCGESGKMNNRKLAKHKNNFVWQNTFAQLTNDGLDRYHVEGIEKNGPTSSLSERTILQSLYWYGSVVIFKKEGGLLALPGAPSGGGCNANGDPPACWLFSCNGKLNEECKLYLPGSDEVAFLKQTNGYVNKNIKLNGVFIRENPLCYPFVRYAMYFADCIADTYRTLDVCRKNIKQPYIIVAEESIINSVKNFFNQRDENTEYIVSSGIFPAEKINLLPFQTHSEDLNCATGTIDWYFNKWKELCGMDNNGNMDKKGENLVEREITVNQEYTNATVDKAINSINKGFDNVNKLYGTNLKMVRNHKKNNSDEGGENDEVRGDEDAGADS